MRMAALMEVLKDDKAVKSVYLLGQDYSFGQAVLREAGASSARSGPTCRSWATSCTRMLRIKDFAPYAAKIKASGADAVITGNFSNDLTLLVKAAREVGFDGKFYTFYGNALGAPAAIGDAGVGRIVAVADWLPNVATAQSEAFYRGFRQRYPKPADDYVHMRMQLMVEALAQAIEKAGSLDAVADRKRAGKSQRQSAGAERHDARARPPVPAAAGGGRDGPAGHARREVRRRRLGLRLSCGEDHRSRPRRKCPRTCKMVRPGVGSILERLDSLCAAPSRTSKNPRSAKSPTPAWGAATCWRSGSAKATKSRPISSARPRSNRCKTARPSTRTTWACRSCAKRWRNTPAACTARSPPTASRSRPGGVNALMLAVQALVDAGDEVVAVTPVWPNLTAQPLIMGARLKRVSLKPIGRRLDAGPAGAARCRDAGHPAAGRQRARTTRPAGRSAGPSSRPSSTIAARPAPGSWPMRCTSGCITRTRANGCAPSFLDIASPDDRLVVVHSFSKSFLMTGWRLGWLVMPAAMTPHMGKLVEFNTSCASVFTQRAGLVALQRTDEVTPRVVAHLKACRDTLVPLLQALPQVELAGGQGRHVRFLQARRFRRFAGRWPSVWWPRPAWAWRPAMPSRRKPRAGCAGASRPKDVSRLEQGVERLQRLAVIAGLDPGSTLARQMLDCGSSPQ